MRTSANYNWNLPEDNDAINVEDLNAIYEDIDENLIKKLQKKKVIALPSTTELYTFDSTTEFTAVERCTLALQTEGSDKFLRVSTADNSGNKYALAQLNFSDIGQTADSFVIEMDTRMPAGRWYVSLVDLTKRPGESNKISYDLTGVAFSCGTTDGSNYNACGTTVFGSTFVNTWLHMRLEVNVAAQTVKYDIRNRSTDTSLASGTVNFRDSGTDKITGIELYTYMQTSIDVDNIKITAGYEIEENVLYLVGNGNVYDSYVYFNGEPVCLSSQTDVRALSESNHTHANKSVLDNISSSDVSHWGTAYSRSHTHNNKTVLDGISSSDVSNWDAKAPTVSPTFTGSPKAPTPNETDNSTRVATTAFVQSLFKELQLQIDMLMNDADAQYLALFQSKDYTVISANPWESRISWSDLEEEFGELIVAQSDFSKQTPLYALEGIDNPTDKATDHLIFFYGQAQSWGTTGYGFDPMEYQYLLYSDGAKYRRYRSYWANTSEYNYDPPFSEWELYSGNFAPETYFD